MKDQITLTDVEYGNRKKTTKREEFLNKMEEIIPWKAWVEMIRPYYPKGEHGRPVREYRDDATDVSDADMVQPVRRRDRGRHI
ncbi:MAG: hypothetical protein L6V84_00380 [Oscillospiraceae bacterium]|nr:MAG: hypothetical protein L6V84_00380 [Oscillospiraceae bacterium]